MTKATSPGDTIAKMKTYKRLAFIVSLGVSFLGLASQSAGLTGEDCVAQNPAGWSLPWAGMKHSALKHTPLLYNGKPTEMRKQLWKFSSDISFAVPGCGGPSRLRTDTIAAIDFNGHVFAYIISGVAVLRDENGHETFLGAVKSAEWLDNDGDGRFETIVWTPQGPPSIPAWVRRPH